MSVQDELDVYRANGYRTTLDVARALGIGQATLQRHVRAGTIVGPLRRKIAGREFLLWRKRDIEKARDVISASTLSSTVRLIFRR